MSVLRLPGLFTGIDTAALIQQLMALERRSLTLYQTRKETWEAKRDALDTLEIKLNSLRSACRALSDADELKAFKVSSSDSDILTADANYNAFEGTHALVINQLATAERWVHNAGVQYAEDYVGTGTFIYSYNHKETSVTTTATTTLSELVGLINNDADNPGVTASLLHYNDAYHLVLNGNDAGSDYAVRINSGTTEVLKSDSEFKKGGENATLNTKISQLDPDQFSGTITDGGPYPYITIDGTDHFGVDIEDLNLTITNDTKISHLIAKINEAFDGKAKAVFEDGKIILTDSEDGTSSLSITLTYNANGSGTNLNNLNLSQTTQGQDKTAELISNFAPSDFTLSQAAQDSKIKVDGFPNTSATSERQTVTLDAAPTAGTFTFTYRGETTAAINYDAAASEIEDALEALSAFSEGDITVSGAIGTNPTIDFASSLGNVDLLMIDISSLETTTTAAITETTPGTDGYISKSSNTIDDVIYGTTLHLHDTTDANGEQITLTRDIEAVKTKLQSMVDSYNLAVNFIKEKAGYNDVLKTAGVLMGDYAVSTIKFQLTNPIISQVNGFVEDLDTFLLPGHIGLEVDRDGLLSLNDNVFDEAIAEDYQGVLNIIGADKTGSSNSDYIRFYGSSSRYTTAGEYTVKATYSAGTLDKVYFKRSSEDDSAYREAAIIDNVATGNSTFDDKGNPVYPEHSLQVTVPTTSASSEITATVRVKQGFTGAMEDALDKILKAVSGSIQIDQEHVKDQIDLLADKIKLEEYRLGLKEVRLINQFARLERTLALMQNQMAALGLGTA